MEIKSNLMLKSAYVINCFGWTDGQIQDKVDQMSQDGKDDELVLFSTLDIQASVDENNHTLIITLNSDNNLNTVELDTLISSLNNLHLVFKDLNIKIVDEHEILKKAELLNSALHTEKVIPLF